VNAAAMEDCGAGRATVAMHYKVFNGARMSRWVKGDIHEAG
jgi:hypothetical protein